MIKRVAILLGLIQAFVAIGGIPAGLSMIFEPNGTGVGMSTEMLLESPFRDFFVPGLFLFVVNGLFNIVCAVISFTRNKYTGIFGLALGIFLVIWVCVQVYFVGLIHFLQPLFFIVGIIEIILSYIFITKTKSITIK